MVKLWVLLGLLAVVNALPEFLALPQVTPYIPTNDTFAASFIAAFLSTLVIEARDKTFVLTALLAATKMRKAVALGALSTMAFLTMVCALIGYIFVPLIEEGWVNWAAVIGYIVFFWLFLKDAWNFTLADVPGSLREQEGLSKPPDKSQELREPLLDPGQQPVESAPVPAAGQQPPLQLNPEDEDSPANRRRRWLDLYTKATILIFLGEWSDATMISTSELAQKNMFWGVFVGCMCAYLVTTTIAVFAGRWLGSHMRYRRMLVLTSFIFLLFAVFTVFY